jgi:ketopantoate reductase
MANIAVVGPGAIGGTTAAWLAQDSRHVLTVAARTAFKQLEVASPYGVITAQPRVLTAPDQAAPVDWVLAAAFATSAMYTCTSPIGRRELHMIQPIHGVIAGLRHHSSDFACRSLCS